jgi:hypothetical protein
VFVGEDGERLLASAGVRREPMVDAGLQFVRRRVGRDRFYFVVNRASQSLDGWVPLAGAAVVRFDPLDADRKGLVPTRTTPEGETQIRLSLEPGESTILRVLERPIAGPPWPESVPAGPKVVLGGTWRVEFVDGGPVRPAGFEATTLGSWTDRGDEDARRFAGTALYTLAFERPSAAADEWQLDLGTVADSGRVKLNGRPVATLWSRPFRARLGPLPEGRSILEVEVTNLAANRIRDLDRRGVRWKRFHDANVVGVDYKPLDASGWPLRPSGLLGPVTLQPMKRETR